MGLLNTCVHRAPVTHDLLSHTTPVVLLPIRTRIFRSLTTFSPGGNPIASASSGGGMAYLRADRGRPCRNAAVASPFLRLQPCWVTTCMSICLLRLFSVDADTSSCPSAGSSNPSAAKRAFSRFPPDTSGSTFHASTNLICSASPGSTRCLLYTSDAAHQLTRVYLVHGQDLTKQKANDVIYHNEATQLCCTRSRKNDHSTSHVPKKLL